MICVIYKRLESFVISLKVGQFLMMGMTSVMTIVPIATQTPLIEFVGEKGCYVYWFVSMTWQWITLVSGFGMAVYRVLAYHNMFKKNFKVLNTDKFIIKAERVVIAVLLLMYIFGFGLLGWEKSILFQFCSDIGPFQAQTIVEHQDKHLSVLIKTIRVFPIIFAQILILGEVFIYVWLIYQLWKHDEISQKKEIITEITHRERNQKNVITLYGQVSSFFVEFLTTIYTIVHTTNNSALDPSVMPISLIVVFTLIALSQFLTSHEMRRFVKNELL